MPRFGLFCSDKVLRVPKLTSLRIVASIFLGLISARIFGISGLPRGLLERRWARALNVLDEVGGNPARHNRTTASSAVARFFDNGRIQQKTSRAGMGEREKCITIQRRNC